jgi:hypothetical protein
LNLQILKFQRHAAYSRRKAVMGWMLKARLAGM